MPTPLTRVLACLSVLAVVTAGCSADDGSAQDRPPAQDAAADASPTETDGSPDTEDPDDPDASGSRSRVDDTGGGEATASARAGTGWGPTAGQTQRARRAVGRMSLAQKAGQVIVARYGGTAPPTSLVRRYHLGGVIVMGDNVRSVDAVRRSNARLQRSDGRPWPLFLGVDQEGGIVNRLNAPMTRFPAQMTYGASGRRDLARRAARASGQELRAAGFTAVFAPDADVTIGSGDPTIGSRSFSSRPRQVARLTTSALRGYRDAGILPVVKHFPGHGSVGTDSHLGLPVQDSPMRRLRTRDLVPFRAAVRAQAPAVMVAHLDVRALDPGTPSTLSRPVISGLLRQRMGFGGLVVTDALEMGAIVDGYGSGAAAVAALRAGSDVLLMPADLPTAHRAIVRAVRSGRLARARLDQAATRVVAAMLHQRSAGPAPGARAIGSHAELSYRASKAGVTSVSGPCRGRLVGRGVSVSGDPQAVAGFRAVARRRGLSTAGGTSVALLGYGSSARRADVVVTTDTPYALGQSGARSKIAVYGTTRGAMRALVDVLLGRAQAPGHLPVRVQGVSRRGC